ncbi:FG-GAP repeat domain-containing protein [Tautonia rosea]|uniref:FG-GAP repeat domain-containing protein n=1 Tax=Tautonia rosea TaxID=2728037 RepID=UPI0014743C60|nr:VCBS repeat-containing protein [Tautonia rosea]
MALSPDGDVLAVGSASSGVDLSGAVPPTGTPFDAGGFLLSVDADQGQFQSVARFRDLAGNANNNLPQAVGVNSSGTIIVAGLLIGGTTDFDPGQNEENIAGSNDSFVARLNANGNFIDVSILASDTGSAANRLRVQNLAIASGNSDIYLVGSYGGTVDFDPGPGRVERVGSGTSDLFLLRLSSTGVFQNVTTLTGPGAGLMSNVALLETGTSVEGVLAAGNFNSNLTLENSSIVLSSQGSIDTVVGRWSPDLSQVDWAHSIGNAQPVFPAPAGGLAIDSGGNVIVGGNFEGTLDLSSIGGDVFVSQSQVSSGTNSYYAVFNGDGVYQRGFQFGGPSSSVFAGFSSLDVDTLLVAGWYFGNQFQVANQTLATPTTDAQNLFISRLTYQDLPDPNRLIGDYDGDGVADLALYRYNPASGAAVFHLRLSNNDNPSVSTVSIPNVSPNVIPIAGDFDGDGKTDVAVVDPFARLFNSPSPNATEWIIRLSTTDQLRRVPFGGPGSLDRPAPADFDGDGRTDIATFRANSDLVPGAAQWFILPSLSNSAFSVVFGAPGGTDLPAPDDYDGDGRADIVTFRPVRTPQDVSNGVPNAAQWFILPSVSNDLTFSERRGAFGILFGASGNADQPSPADFNGDGRAEIVGFRSNSDLNPGSADWFILQSSPPSPGFSNGIGRTFGVANEIAAVADYTGDGTPDLTVFNRSTGVWTIRSGTDGPTQSITFNHPLGQAVPVLSPLFFRLQASGNLPTQTSGVAVAAQSSRRNDGLLLFDSGGSTSPSPIESIRSQRGSLIDSALDSLMDDPLV